MIEQEHLKYCLLEFEKKLNWNQSKFWKESDYIKLSQIISDASNISISPHTLKRLFGKIKYKKYYNPQVATKDALSKYISFSDWNHFVEQNTGNLIEKNENLNATIKKSKYFKKVLIYVSVAMLAALLALLFLSRTLKTSKSSTEYFSFVLNDSIGTVPYTVPITYDFTDTTLDSIYIDFNFNHPYQGVQTIKP